MGKAIELKNLPLDKFRKRFIFGLGVKLLVVIL